MKEIKLFLLEVTPRFYTSQKEFFNNPLQKKLAKRKKLSRFGSKIHAAYIDGKFFLVSKTVEEKRVAKGLVGKMEKKRPFFFLLLNNQM